MEYNKFNSEYDYNRIIIDYLKQEQLDKKTAIRYNKLLRVIKNYNTIDDMILCENDYYGNYNCYTKHDKVAFEIKIIKMYLLDMFQNEKSLSKNRNVISDVINKLYRLEKMITLFDTDEDMDAILEQLVFYELDFNIEIKLLFESYNLLRTNLIKGEELNENRCNRR